MVYVLKGRLLKKIFVFCENRRFNVLFHRLSSNRGKNGKNSLLEPRQTTSAKIEHSGFISPKWAVKSRMNSRIFWGYNRGILCLIGVTVGDGPSHLDYL